jgi:HEAT repeat protein
MRVILMTILTESDTDADQAGSFGEFVAYQAMDVRMAVAEALTRIAPRTDSVTQQKIRSSLLTAVQRTRPGQEAGHLLHCLAQASTDGSLDDLTHLLAQPDLNPALRWQVVEQLGTDPQAEILLRRFLEQGMLDDFTRSKLVYTLGCMGSLTALPLLRQLAEQRDGDIYLRMQAIVALGKFTDPAVETTLLHIVADVTTTPALRGAAAESLPETLRPDMRRWLYELLRRERQPAELVAGVLHTLGRARDHEALGLMLRYTQSEIATIAMAALNALADIGDPNVAPNLIRVTQNRNIEQSIRLHAVKVLLQLCGAEYLPLLRGYLESSQISLQLSAFESLLALRPNEPLPLVLVTHKTAPMSLRLRAVEALAQRTDEHGVLCSLLLDQSDELLLRIAAARLLGHTTHSDAVPTLIRSAQDNRVPLRLRRRCIEALLIQAQRHNSPYSVAGTALGQLAEATALPDEMRVWAVQALLTLLIDGSEASSDTPG